MSPSTGRMPFSPKNQHRNCQSMSSSPPTKPYKSRLLNFLNRQYINLNSQVNLRFRQLSYLVSVGIKTLIYPLHLLVENSKKKLRNNLASSAQNKSEHSRLNPDFSGATLSLPHCDQLIVDVNHIMTAHQTIKELNPSQYSGLACNIINHKLVFINQSNEINDILSPQQQRELSVIIREIRGDYWQKNRLKKLQEDNSHKNQSIRILAFNQLQKIKQDLDQLESANLVEKKESENLVDSQQHNHPLVKTKDNSPKILLFFDQNLAKLENVSLFKSPNHSDNNQLENQIFQPNLNDQLQEEKQTEINSDNHKFSLSALIQSAIEYFFGSHKQASNLPQDNNNQELHLDLLDDKNRQKSPLNSGKIEQVNQQIKGLIEQSRSQKQEIMPAIKKTTEKLVNQGLNQIATVQENLVNRPINEENPFQIQALIWAAIDYFFQPNKQQNNLSSQQNKSPILPFITYEELMVVDNEITDPWLSWADLFGEDFSGQELAETSTNALPETKIIKTQIQEENEENSLRKKKAITESGLLHTIALTEKPVKIVSAKEKILEEEKEERVGEIEAKVIEIKYEKHLLELILEKLDQIILWLEELLIKIWQSLKSLMKRKQQAK